MPLKTIAAFLFFMLLHAYKMVAQDPLLRHYSTNDGLASSTAFPMMQDKDGFIWFGTDVGVTRFDGKRFQNFTLADGLSDNYILNVKADSKGRIWFLGFNGTVSYWLNGKIYNASSDTVLIGIASEHSFVDFFEDNQNRLWFSSLLEHIILENNKVTRIDPKIIAYAGIVLNGKSRQILLSPTVPLLSAQYKAGKMYPLQLKYKITQGSGYFRFQDESVLFVSDEGIVSQIDTIQKLIIPFHGEFNHSRHGSMTLSKDSMLWVSIVGKGLYCYSLKNPNAKPIVYLKSETAVGVLGDKEGNIWVSTTDNGIYMISERGKVVKILNKKIGLPHSQSYAVCKRPNGDLLVGLLKGNVASISNRKGLEVKTPLCDNSYNKITRIICRKDDTWIASECGLIHQNSKTGCNHFVSSKNWFGNYEFKKIPNVKDITLSNNDIYLANGFLIFSYPLICPRNPDYSATLIEEKSRRVYSIYCDHSSKLWYGTVSGLRSKSGEEFFDHSKENELLKARINSIAETEDSILILGTHGFGILLYKNGKVISQVTNTLGLANNICRRVFVHKNRIYVSTPSGVSVLFYSNGKVQSVQNLNTGNFLPSDDVNDVFADDVDISVATMDGVAVIGQWALGKTVPAIPMLHIREIRVNDSIISSESEGVFPYDRNSLKFSFIGIYYRQPNAVNYRYRLKANQPWEITQNNDLEFSYLPSGKYMFQLQARVQNGNWSNMKSFSFTITPPYWKTIWFLLSVLLVVGLIIYIVVKRRLNAIKSQHEEKAKIVKQITELEQQALQTMMNPHFIFNVMNSIQHFINANDKEAANHYLTDFATLIRMNLTICYKRFIPLDEELDYLILYLSFEKLRLGDYLTYEINVDPLIDTSETTIAVMMIQPFIENAVWHGILPMNARGHIRIGIYKETNDLIRITIEDNGIGIDEKFIMDDIETHVKRSHALSMTIQRLKLLEKSSMHKLHIHFRHAHPEKENKGTIAELILPATFY